MGELCAAGSEYCFAHCWRSTVSDVQFKAGSKVYFFLPSGLGVLELEFSVEAVEASVFAWA